MRKALRRIIFTSMLVVVALAFSAKASAVRPRSHPEIVIPKYAVELAPGTFYLGPRLNNGWPVEGYVFLRYKGGFGKPVSTNSRLSTSGCYSFLALGAKWKALENYIVDPTNTEGLDGLFVRNNLAANIGKWERAATRDILGDEVNGIVDGIDLRSPDDKNEIYFANITEPGVIAMTVVWGVFQGPIGQRRLIEWDQVYDQDDFDWSSIGGAGKMDFENIATHELGHSVGLGDVYAERCWQQTMYGYADYGETHKRTLEIGDITGVRMLYGR